jgi:hypothetical protein
MTGKAVISLTAGLEDPEKVTVAFLVAVAAAEQQRPTLAEDTLVDNAVLGGTVPLWERIGHEPATTFSY